MSLINKTEVSLEEKYAKALEEEARIDKKLATIKGAIKRFKKEGRTEDTTFAIRVQAVWLDLYIAQGNYAAALYKISKWGDTFQPFCDLAEKMKKKILQNMAKLTIANRTLYNEIIGCNLIEQDLDSLKRLAEGK